MSDLRIFPDEFVPNVQGADYYAKWLSANRRGDGPRWIAFRDALLAGQSPTPPEMATRFGKALVAAGKEHMSILHGAMFPPSPPLPNPVPSQPQGQPALPPNGWGGPLIISSGGVYDGMLTGVGWESTSPGTPSIRLDTAAPVTIRGWVRHLSGGVLIEGEAGTTPTGAQVTLEHLFAYGGYPYTNSGRLIRLVNFKSFTMQNCTIDATRGTELESPIAGASILITRNKHHNIQGFNNPAGDTDVGNFIQSRIVTNANPYEVSWNEIINEYNLSEPTDMFNFYFSAHVRIHDNFIRHQSRVGNVTPSSQNTITFEGDSRMTDNIAQDNQVVDAYGIGLHANAGMGSNNSFLNNRIVADQFLPNGVQKANGLGAPLFIAVGGSNNHAHGNVVGYIDASGTKTDFDLAGAAEGGAAEAANNTSMPLPINAATEQNEFTLWQAKLAANGITIGA